MRLVPGLPRYLPDQSLPGAGADRCAALHQLPHHRAQGAIPRDLRPLMGNRIYGCDDCLAVCPWNKYARLTAEPAFLPRAELAAPRLADLAALDDAGFRAVFRKSAIKRIGRDRFVRNVLIAIGNSGSRGVGRIRRKAVAGCVGAGPRRGGVGPAAARSGSGRGAPAPRRGGGDGPGKCAPSGRREFQCVSALYEPLRRGVPRYGAQARLLGMRKKCSRNFLTLTLSSPGMQSGAYRRAGRIEGPAPSGSSGQAIRLSKRGVPPPHRRFR